MGRHAKPHNLKEQDPQEDSGADEQHPSKGRHAKDRHLCTGRSAEQAAP
ncbi:hypothetical protein GCM10009850_114550 [Nonomuraea monospora]|uniref:Uncharacterized protein n=1 Tax=Nonomuraea monospora TaxID=568818 RepID=A0ABN3D2E2_9ACTN